jgi:WD40 repeat protein
MNHHALRLTPSNSPFHKTTASPRSPTRFPKPDEPGLQLRHVIGTTTSSSTAFDCLPSSRLFAHTAGACAVLAEVKATDGLTVKQRFYRARPAPTGTTRDGGATPTPGDPRHRALGYVREQSVGGSPLASSRDWSDSPAGRSTTAKDRVKAATSVALSPNGKWLALGETGYKPRIAIFCLADESSDSPVTTISEHSFGVHALRFSPDSKYLASLGTVNDGFIYIWNIEDKTGAASLQASNKLTTLTNAVAWVGDAVVTAGLRFIKLWRPNEDANPDLRTPELASTSTFLAPKSRADMRSADYGNSILSPRHKTLAGKNVLLGELLECNFITVVPVSDNEAVICAETGEICLLNDRDKAQSLTLIATSTFAISSARLDESGLLQILGQEGCVKTLSPAEYAQPERPQSRSRRQPILPARPASSSLPSTVATAALGPIAVELDSERVLTLRSQEDQAFTQLAAHREAVQGVCLCRSEALPSTRFLTFSANGLIQFWDSDGALDAFLNIPVPPAPSTQNASNELKSVVPLIGGACIASGDKYGVLSIADVNTKALVKQVRAHSAEIMDLCAFQIEEVDFIATAGRDRMSQLFMWKSGQLSLQQTMDEHAGAVTGVLFQDEERRLITHSADRSIVVREVMFREEGNIESLAFVMLRAITVKTSPTSMCLTGDDELLIATVDRCIGRYRIKNGQCVTSFKCSDADGGEAAVISKVLYAPSLNGSPAIAGVASSDKSVRLYTESGSLIARDWGHTEGITDAVYIPADGTCSTARLVTVAADSTIFIWDTVLAAGSSPDPGGLGIVLEASSIQNDVALIPPLRKIISRSDLSSHRRLKPASESDAVPTSPTAPKSPQRLRKKPSRISTAPTPRLEPAFLSVFPTSPSSLRRGSIRHRSPSPPPPLPRVSELPTTKPRSQTTRSKCRTTLATTLGRFNKSSDNVPTKPKSTTHSNSPTPVLSATPTTTAAATSSTAASSLATSTDSLSRSLRSYRKRLNAQVAASTSNPTATASGLPPLAALRELEKELRLSLLALGTVTGSGETPPSSSWVVEDGNGNIIANGAGGGDENKKTTGACDSETDSRTASAGAGAGLLDEGFAVGNGLSCRADEDNDENIMEVVGEDLEDAVDLDSVGGALREMRLDA